MPTYQRAARPGLDLSRYTDEQRAIIEASKSSKKLIVNALAGSGKTTTALACASANSNTRGVYLCFNRANAESMKAKIARKPGAYNLDVMTAHSFAFRHVARDLINRGKTLAASVPVELIEENCRFMDENGHKVSDYYKRKRLARLAYDTVSAFCHSKVNDIKEFRKEYSNIQLNLQFRNLSVNKEAFYDEVERLWDIMIDTDRKDIPFTHDCYLKLFDIHYHEIISGSRYGFLIADEAQDLFPVVESIVEKIHQSGARLLCLGDRFQQIYAWNKSINTMSRLEQDADILYLTKSFRCPPEVTEVALPWLRLLGYKGEFIGRDAMDDFSGMGKFAILSRTNSGVILDINTALENLGDPGRIHLVGNGPSYDFSVVMDRISFIHGDFNAIKHPGMKQCPDEDAYVRYANAAMDREMESARFVVEKLGARKVMAIITMIRNNDFCERPERAEIAISTAHKAKGLEFASVQIGESFRDIEDEYGNYLDRMERNASSAKPDSGLLSSLELDAAEDNMFADEHAVGGIKPMPFDAEELRLNYVALTRSANVIYPGSLELDDARFAATKQLLAEKRVVLKDKNIHGNMVLYDAGVDYKTLQVHEQAEEEPETSYAPRM